MRSTWKLQILAITLFLFVSFYPDSCYGSPIDSETVNEEEKENQVKEEDSSEAESDYWAWASSEELECSEEEFFHIRGRRCVPYYCPDSKRNVDTGECLYKFEPYSNNGFDEFEFGLSSSGWPIGSFGFFQPRGLSLNPLHKIHNGKRAGSIGFGGVKARLRETQRLTKLRKNSD